LKEDSKIYVAGGSTFIGAAILRSLDRLGYQAICGRGQEEPILTDARQVDRFFEQHAPEYVFLVGGKSGGIKANLRYPADLILDNLLVECHVVQSAFHHRVRKLLYLASSCSYPRLAPQPMKEDSLMTGPLEPTNEAYAVAKIAGITLCKSFQLQYSAPFISAIPANAFGPGDAFDPDDSHVIPALIFKMHRAKADGLESVEVWGSGVAKREFISVDDLADACLFVMNNYEGLEPINIGGGTDISIRDLARLVREVVGYSGHLVFDASKPDGMPLKALDSSRLKDMGWQPRRSLKSTIEETYRSFLKALP
jgi:GDP-L-fucose synthase